MDYKDMIPGIFLRRPNRFIAHVEIRGKEEICHVKNTGRCRELLQPGTQVWCQEFDSPTRKTKFDLITVQKGERLINMDSQAPNAAGCYGCIFGRCTRDILAQQRLAILLQGGELE